MRSRVRKNYRQSAKRNESPVESMRSAPVLPDQVSVNVGKGGRIVIPAPYRKALDIGEGDIKLEGEELRIVSDETELRRIREMIAQYVPEGVSLVDELILERRREVAAEEEWSRQHLSDYGRSEPMKDVRDNESINLTDQKS